MDTITLEITGQFENMATASLVKGDQRVANLVLYKGQALRDTLRVLRAAGVKIEVPQMYKEPPKHGAAK